MTKIAGVIIGIVFVVLLVALGSWIGANLALWVLGFWHIKAPFYGLWALFAIGPTLLDFLLPSRSTSDAK